MKGSRTIMILGVAFCLLALVATSSGESKPIIVDISGEQIKSTHDDVEFKCTVQDTTSTDSVQWIKHDNETKGISSDGFLTVKNPRYNITVTGNTYTLSIHDLEDADMARYECKIQGKTYVLASQSVLLQMNRPPKIDQNVTREVYAVENGTAILNCSASGFPTPTITWRRQDKVLLFNGKPEHKGNVLKLGKVNKVDRGVYYCLAQNTVNDASGRPVVDQVNVTLHVEFAPVVTAIRPSVGQAKYYDASLECKVEGYPTPKVTWFDKHNNKISSNVNQIVKDDMTISVITIYNVEESSYGLYTCRAENKYGSDETKLNLYEMQVAVGCTGSSCR